MAEAAEGLGSSGEKKVEIFLNQMQLNQVLNNERIEFRCPFRVGREVLLAARLGQRPPSWSRRPSERRSDGV